MKNLLFFTIVIFSCVLTKKITKSKLQEFENQNFKMNDLRIANTKSNNKIHIIAISIAISMLYLFVF